MTVSDVDNPPRMVRHNYSAVDGLITHLQEKHHAEEANWRARTWTQYACWGAIVLVGVGVAAFLILWGVSLVLEKPEPKVIETERIIERPVTLQPNITVNESATGAVSSADQANEREINEIRRTVEQLISSQSTQPGREDSTGVSTAPAASVFNFVIFHERPFNVAGFDNVNIGMEYADTTSKRPSSQWCYIVKPRPSGSGLRIDLATLTSGQRIDNTFTTRLARDAETTVDVLLMAQSLCQFR